ncbi:ETX/MTX2 family pore-forming toxin [Bacillus paramycoides]|uniref:ETX/MTX2 family pore-forming toxin n=1 Tax=Bacillus paramycoides TaxID=2026194 RepID=UPI002E207760|nr:ETX/MTX2 family pore-forming toxin [Bacillus paramycoides]
MKKNNKKTKQILSLAALGAIGTSLAFTSPGSVSAAQISPIQAVTQEQGSVSISDWQDPFKNAFNVLQKHDPGNNGYQITNYSIGNVYQNSVEADGSPTVTNSNSLFVGKTTLNNNSDQEQVLTTDQFSKAFENSVTSSTTNGFNLGVSATSSFGIPLIGETSVQISTEYNFSKTDTNTKSETYTYTASPQNIKVPAHSSVEVIVNLNTAKINGNVKLLSKVDGQYNFEGPGFTGAESLAELVRKAEKYETLSDVKSGDFYDQTVYLIGHGKYSAEYGTEFSVTVRPVDKPSSSSAKFSNVVAENSKSTNEGYTYTVKPEVKNEK